MKKLFSGEPTTTPDQLTGELSQEYEKPLWRRHPLVTGGLAAASLALTVGVGVYFKGEILDFVDKGACLMADCDGFDLRDSGGILGSYDERLGHIQLLELSGS